MMVLPFSLQTKPLMPDVQLSNGTSGRTSKRQTIIGKLHERQQNVPVFLLGDREKPSPQWIATCWSLSMNSPGSGRYRRLYRRTRRCRDDPLPQQLLPPLFSALMKYSDIHEYPGQRQATRAALVLPKHPPDVLP